METFLIKALQLILSLSILVFVHELGHFGFARLFKVRVDKFYLFFNPKFSLVRLKKINGKWQVRWFAPNLPDHLQPLLDAEGLPKHDKKGKPIMVPAPVEQLDDNDWRKYPETTEWGIGWLPLGGYCKIAGMVDESMDPAVLNSEPQAWEYRSRPAWQRLFIITGGVLMNFITAIVLYGVLLFTWGQEQLPVQNAYLGYDYCETALKNGFQNGDIVLAVNGEAVHLEKDALEKIVIEGKQNVTVRRHSADTLIVLPKDFGEQMLAAEEKEFMAVRVPFVIDQVADDSPAAAAGLQAGDSVVGLNGKAMAAFQDISKELELCKSQRVALSVMRGGVLVNDTIAVSEDGKMGVQLRNPMPYFKTEKEAFSFFEAIPAGWHMMTDVLSNYIKQFRLVFTKEGAKSLGGFGAIGNLFPATWNWQIFWNMTAFLSVILAFMNILPIPILDGGYVLFLLYEIIARRKPSDKFMEISLNIGMFLLFALLIYANGNDILRLFR